MMADGQVVPKSGNRIDAMAREVRRGLLFEAAANAIGAGKLAAGMGVGRRCVNHKIACDRSLTDADLIAAADTLEARAATLVQLAAHLREVSA